MMIAKVNGSFNEFSGNVEFDESNSVNSSVDITINAASTSTGQERHDNQLRSPDFFDVEQYLVLTFKGKRVSQTMGQLKSSLAKTWVDCLRCDVKSLEFCRLAWHSNQNVLKG
jgi:polyisoprenoid-binding protein YceI